LRISGRIPQVIASAEEAAPLAPPLPLLNWPHFTAFAGASAAPLLRDEGDAFAIFAAPIKDPPCALEAALWLAAAPPLPSSRPATWPI
jgi:hypothetical protein